MASPAVKYSSSCYNQLHSSSAVKDLEPELLRPPAAGLNKSKRENERAGERAPDGSKRGRERVKRIKRADKDRLRPPVPLSYWPRACPALAATDDITV